DNSRRHMRLKDFQVVSYEAPIDQFADQQAVSTPRGPEQTCALQKAMSASPPIATAKADIRKTPCPLYPRKRTCAVQDAMSAKGQKRTSAGLAHGIRKFVAAIGPMPSFAILSYIGRSSSFGYDELHQDVLPVVPVLPVILQAPCTTPQTPSP